MLPRRLALALAVTACGPTPADTSDTSDTSATSDAPASTTEPTTGPDAPSVCLTPHPEGIAVATDAAQCINSEDAGGAIELTYETWPELVYDDCSHAEVEVDVPCVATAIDEQTTAVTITLRCTDDAAELHELTLTVTDPALFFPVCTGDELRLRYAFNDYGCPNGGHSEALVLRAAATEAILVAKFVNRIEPWLAPLDLAVADDAGCESSSNSCITTTRSAARISEAMSAPALVYDGTRRIAELGARYVVQPELVFETSPEGCETFSSVEILLARVDP